MALLSSFQNMSKSPRIYKKNDLRDYQSQLDDNFYVRTKRNNYDLFNCIFKLKSIKGRELKNIHITCPIVSFHLEKEIIQGMDNLYFFEAKFYKNNDEIYFGPIQIIKRQFTEDSNFYFSELFRKALSLTMKYRFFKDYESGLTTLQLLSKNNCLLIEFTPDDNID